MSIMPVELILPYAACLQCLKNVKYWSLTRSFKVSLFFVCRRCTTEGVGTLFAKFTLSRKDNPTQKLKQHKTPQTDSTPSATKQITPAAIVVAAKLSCASRSKEYKRPRSFQRNVYVVSLFIAVTKATAVILFSDVSPRTFAKALPVYIICSASLPS